ncbi:TetR/AcrR family transcriptional regulator [Plantibacter flavus]|uniref:TetR/AcrR family transcriptional regulator n=1 Tax=Plantibacter flavus TaxID=150123 RepID=UPI003F5CD047
MSKANLNRQKVLAAAVEIADAGGIAALTMRSLADAVGIQPMSLYHYVPNKDAILDGIIDAVFAEIDLPRPDRARAGGWREEVRARCVAMRAALNRHPWALALMESRPTPGHATLTHHDAMLATLRAAGFSLQLTAHAYAAIDAFVYGFALQEASLPSNPEGDLPGDEFLAHIGEAYPQLAAFTVQHAMQPGYAFADSFAFGLDLVLDGVAHASEREQGMATDPAEVDNG